MLKIKFNLPQSPYEELAQVIKAYSHFPQPTGPDEVGRLVGLESSVVNRNVGFLLAVEILEPGTKKVSTPTGRKLGHALEQDSPADIRTWWRHIILNSDFLKDLLSAIKIRDGVVQQALEAHIVDCAGYPDRMASMSGARTVVDVLKAAELIVDRDGTWALETAGVGQQGGLVPAAQGATDGAGAETVEQTPPEIQTRIAQPRIQASGAVQITIQVNINCQPADVEGLVERLRRMLGEITEGQDRRNRAESRGE